MTHPLPPEVIFNRVIWTPHHANVPLRLSAVKMHDLLIQPDPAHPHGRKGLAIASSWSQLGAKNPAVAGMLLLDGDVAIDPYDWVMMRDAWSAEPLAVHTAAVRIWPVSTGFSGWSWAHWHGEPGQGNQPDPDFFSFNFTYLPRALMDAAIRDGLKTWQYPHVDKNTSRIARQLGLTVRVVPGCYPKHMHY